MVTFKRLRSLGLTGLFFTVCMMAVTTAKAQLVEATVLTTNVDVQNKRLYAEMNFTPRACGNYQLRFKLRTDANNEGLYKWLELDSVITNQHGNVWAGGNISDYTYEGGGPENNQQIKVLNFDNTAVGGYSLRFKIVESGSSRPMITAEMNPVVCMETYKLAYRCKFCGIGRSDIVFTPKDVEAGCPYRGDDVVACSQRVGGAKNWEAYIQDPRDCNVYRVVQMPDGFWWFAQNLNYQKDLTHEGPLSTKTRGAFFCPGRTMNSADYDDINCLEYGALYTWETATALDGRNDVTLESSLPSVTTPSIIRGVCPPDWLLPNDAQWGIMLNHAEGGCSTPSVPNNEREPLNPPCNHLTTDNRTAVEFSGALQGTTNSNTTQTNISALGNMGPAGSTGVRYAYGLGENAGKALKATGTCGDGANCDNRTITAPTSTVNNNSNLPLPQNARRWMNSTGTAGSDYYGMAVLAAGYRYSEAGAAGSSSLNSWYGRGQYAAFTTSTAWTTGPEASPVVRLFSYDRTDVQRFYSTGTTSGLNSAYSVRCVKAH